MKKLDGADLAILLLVVGAIICVVTGHPQSAETFGLIAFFFGMWRYAL